MTANLPEVVSNFGPLFVYSCFPFENHNRKLLKFVKGTQYVDLQIIEAMYKIISKTSTDCWRGIKFRKSKWSSGTLPPDDSYIFNSYQKIPQK